MEFVKLVAMRKNLAKNRNSSIANFSICQQDICLFQMFIANEVAQMLFVKIVPFSVQLKNLIM